MILYELKKKIFHELEKTSSSALLDAKILIKHVLGIEDVQYITDTKRLIKNEELNALESLVEKRASSYSVAKILGYKDFYYHRFETNEYTLDPRPDSEFIVEMFIMHHADKNIRLNIADFGCGTGCLSLTVLDLYQNIYCDAYDISEDAINVAQKNAANLGLQERYNLINEDFTKIENAVYDVIISNPPYISTEDIEKLEKEVRIGDPYIALDGGKDGLKFYRKIAELVDKSLKSNGMLILECGAGQDKEIIEIFLQKQLKLVEIMHDFGDIARVIAFKK